MDSSLVLRTCVGNICIGCIALGKAIFVHNQAEPSTLPSSYLVIAGKKHLRVCGKQRLAVHLHERREQ